MLAWKSANLQLRLAISNRRAGMEVLGEWDVSWKELPYKARQDVVGALVIDVLLQETSRNEQALNNFEII